jgi:alkaline phosphatase D
VDEVDITAGETPEIVAVVNGGDGPVAKVVKTRTEVAVSETIVPREKPINPWSAILTGAPNPRSLFVTALPLLVNALCVGMVADRLFRERYYPTDDLSFIRVGYVSDTEAKMVIREPDQSKMPVTIQIHIKDPQPPFDNPTWQTVGGVKWTTNETDYTAVVNVPLRFSKQRTYEWKSSNNHSGEFMSPPRAGRVSDLENGKFTFLSTSCIVNRLPYNPLDHPLSIPGMRHLAKVLPSLKAQFMLFLGDFIYVDVPHQWGKGAEDYRQKYRKVYASPEWQSVGQNLSWIHVLDDHEISNDWSSNTTGVYKTAMEPWHRYHAAANPPQAKKAGAMTARSGATYFEFTQGPASFFLLDTRSYRSANSLSSNSSDKTMLGEEQLEDFLAFLSKPEPKGVKWKFVASSVPFTKNWRVNTIDTWGGFLFERKKLLEAMWDAGSRGYGVVILSGDRHEFAATKFPPPANSSWPQSATVHEFSASPLSQFYSPVPSYRQTDEEDVTVK